MELLTAHRSGAIQRSSRNGRNYLVAPMTLIVPGVLPGSHGPLLYPPDELAKNPSDWNAIPIVCRHPQVNGRFVSARHPEIIETYGLGQLYNAQYGDKLTAEGWFDEEDTKRVDHRIYDALVNATVMEISTGLFSSTEKGRGVWNGRGYHGTARNYRPDHLAVLPDQKGACSVEDGCGLFVNLATDLVSPGDQAGPQVYQWLDLVSLPQNPDGSMVTNGDGTLLSNPLVSEHAARVEDPSKFKKDSFRRKPLTGGVSIILAKRPNSDTMEVQSYRFSTSKFTAAQARAWLKKHKIKARLEPARKQKANVNSAGTNGGQPSDAWQRVGRILGLNQPSHDDIRTQLSSQLFDRLKNSIQVDLAGEPMSYPWVVDVFDKYIIFAFKGKSFKLGYSTDLRTDEVTLSDDDPVEVRRVMRYKPVANSASGAQDSNPNEPGDKMPKLTAEQKKQFVDHLTTNCACQGNFPWKGKSRTDLEALDDGMLQAYHEWSLAATPAPAPAPTPAPAANNAPSSPGQMIPVWNPQANRYELHPLPAVPIAQPVSTPAPGATSPTGNTGGTQTTPPRQDTEDEWFRRAPDSVKTFLQFGKEAMDRERAGLVVHITANMVDGEAKNQAIKVYTEMDINNLRAIAAGIPAKQEVQATQSRPSFWGQQGAPPLGPVTNVTPLLPPKYDFTTKN
jgi:hypothetical protein